MAIALTDLGMRKAASAKEHGHIARRYVAITGVIAEGAGQTLALVTSRFPLSDLHLLLDRGYRHLDVNG